MHIIFRVDALPETGTGHIMRCLALAQELKNQKHECVFISCCQIDPLKNRIYQEGFNLTEIDKGYPGPNDLIITSAVIKQNPASWIILDGYHFDSAYQEQINDSSNKVLVIDDTAIHEKYHADIILNQNLDARRLNYICRSETELLLGLRYVLLRQEFVLLKKQEKVINRNGNNILITMGGSDPENTTSIVVDALSNKKNTGLKIKVLIGSGYQHKKALENQLGHSATNAELVYATTDMPGLMNWADIAVTAAGSTCWELAYMGVPAITITLAENQKIIAESLAKKNYSINCGWSQDINKQKLAETVNDLLADHHARERMSKTGQRLVDGKGCFRVVKKLTSVIN